MNIDTIAKIAGVLGFLISVSTFVLTRFERRKKIEIEAFYASDYDFSHLSSDPESLAGESLIKVRFTNMGSQPVILKPETLVIESEGKKYLLCREDYWGKEEFDELLPPTSSREIGVFLDEVLKKLGIVAPNKYEDDSFNKMYPVTITVKDHTGKSFKNNKISYHEAVGEFVK